jgi:hypothetical protein
VGANATASSGGNGGQGYTLTSIDSNLTSGNFTSLSGMTVISSGGGGGTQDINGGGVNTRGVGGTGAGSGAVSNGGTNVFTSSAAVSYGSGGGGGGWNGGSNANGANGKSGVVIVRYPA